MSRVAWEFIPGLEQSLGAGGQGDFIISHFETEKRQLRHLGVAPSRE